MNPKIWRKFLFLRSFINDVNNTFKPIKRLSWHFHFQWRNSPSTLLFHHHTEHLSQFWNVINIKSPEEFTISKAMKCLLTPKVIRCMTHHISCINPTFYGFDVLDTLKAAECLIIRFGSKVSEIKFDKILASSTFCSIILIYFLSKQYFQLNWLHFVRLLSNFIASFQS